MNCARVFGSTAACALTIPRRCTRPSSWLRGIAIKGIGSQAAGFKSHALRHPPTEWKTLPYRPPSIHPHADLPIQPRPEQLRAMMRLVTHSVVVCTSVSATGAARAMTMSSFNSLSLDPPVVTFHVATPSRTLDAVTESGSFNIHILAGDVSGAKVADWFTRGNLKDGLWEGEALEGVGVRINGEGTVEPPVLHGKGVMYVLRCKLFEEAYDGVIKVRKHAIVLGEVVEILEGSAKEQQHSDERFGLVYADRRYRLLGNTLVKVPGVENAKKKE